MIQNHDLVKHKKNLQRNYPYSYLTCVAMAFCFMSIRVHLPFALKIYVHQINQLLRWYFTFDSNVWIVSSNVLFREQTINCSDDIWHLIQCLNCDIWSNALVVSYIQFKSWNYVIRCIIHRTSNCWQWWLNKASKQTEIDKQIIKTKRMQPMRTTQDMRCKKMGDLCNSSNSQRLTFRCHVTVLLLLWGLESFWKTLETLVTDHYGSYVHWSSICWISSMLVTVSQSSASSSSSSYVSYSSSSSSSPKISPA